MADRAGGVLLDSSVVIAYLRGRLDIRQQVLPSEPLFLPLVALGELHKGALRSQRPAENLQQIGELMALMSVLNPDGNTALKYAHVAAGLERHGASIPENDM